MKGRKTPWCRPLPTTSNKQYWRSVMSRHGSWSPATRERSRSSWLPTRMSLSPYLQYHSNQQHDNIVARGKTQHSYVQTYQWIVKCNGSKSCINKLHLPKKNCHRCYSKSPTAQDVFRPIPGLISSTWVTGRWGLFSHAQNAVRRLALSTKLVEALWRYRLFVSCPSCSCLDAYIQWTSN